ncbi:MAG: adenylate kinase [Candidatus Aminicenantaceae bacterium]
MRIILLGPPGCGKGTQGDLIQGKYGFPRISSGDLLRDSVQRGTPLGLQAEAFMNRGELVSDDVVVGMIQERIGREDCRVGFILDGFPRTVHQAERLLEIDPGRDEIVLDIRVDDQAIIERLSARRICSGCGSIHTLSEAAATEPSACHACGGSLIQRDDDKSEVIRRRLKVYCTQTTPLEEYYREKNVYHAVEGQGRIEEIFARIEAVLERSLPGLALKPEASAKR